MSVVDRHNSEAGEERAGESQNPGDGAGPPELRGKQRSTEGTDGERKYFATFVGFFPADDPQVTILVSIDEPDPTTQDRFGGTAAAPVFADLAQVAISELGIVPTSGDSGCPVEAG